MVFHRNLDFKKGLDFYPGPFFILCKAAFLACYNAMIGNMKMPENISSEAKKAMDS